MQYFKNFLNRGNSKLNDKLKTLFFLYPSKHVLLTNVHTFMLNVLYVHAKYFSGV